MKARDRELDRLFGRMYEDNVAGKIDDERFARMSKQYSVEQKELAGKIATVAAELDRQDAKTMTAEMFISTVHKYTRAKKLSERMLGELVQRIEVHQAQKVDGVHVQRLAIHYNCVGEIEVPDTLAVPEITMQTRKGVAISYLPALAEAI